MTAGEPRASRARIVAHVLPLAALFAALLAWSWSKWPDALVDFGRELYVPWRLSEGERLHEDLAWFNGPLSPHWNALAFEMFGVGLSTLVWVNVALFALLLALLHYVLRSFSSAFAASVACAAVIALCGFLQLVGIGNYDFVTPYSHEVTHGVLLGIAALAALRCWADRRAIQWVVAAGACVGLAFLTKPETFVAALAGAVAGTWAHSRAARFPFVRSGVALALGALTPPLVAWAMLSAGRSSDAAWSATLGAWTLLDRGVSDLPFYRAMTGLDRAGENVVSMAIWAAGSAVALLPALAVARVGRGGKLAPVVAFVISAGGAAALSLWSAVRWPDAARPWPLFALVAGAMSFVAVLRRRGGPSRSGELAFAALALAMLAKIALNTRISHYGFALALPATALIVVELLHRLPQLAASRGGDARGFRGGALGLVAAFCAVHVLASAQFYERKDVPIGSGRDAFLGDARSRFVDEALQWLERERRPGAPPPTLAVLPEGATINYLARLDNPTPYVNFMPPELLLFGEEAMVAAFRASPPDVVLLVHKDTSEYGAPLFGRDYGQGLFRWVVENYEPVALFGDPPLGFLFPGEPPLQRRPAFGIRALVRKRAS